MPLEIIRGDITRIQADAIVNAANVTLLGGGGVDGAIHRAAGPGLLAECVTLMGCRTGEAKITGGHRLPAKHVIHTVGPVWHGGKRKEKEKLISCYRNSLKLAKENDCKSIAFPLISAGAYGYPKREAFRVAVDTINEFLLENDMLVYIVVFEKESLRFAEEIFADIRRYIDDHYVETHLDGAKENARRLEAIEEARYERNVVVNATAESAPEAMCSKAQTCATLDGALKDMDESFTQSLLRLIDEKDMKDSQCYKRANLDRKLFSKIRNDVHYKPSKRTALALAIALELPLHAANDLLRKAGYVLSHSSKFDVIVEYFIVNGKYNIHEINEALFFYDQQLLGG